MKKRVIRGITSMLALVLTAKLGTIQYQGHKETWYDLNMSNVIARTDRELGLSDYYNTREDGVKCYGTFVIVAADPIKHQRYTLVETSLGTGIVLDVHTADDPELIDIATAWKGGK